MSKKLTIEEFISRSNEIHSGKYGYKQTVYTDTSTKVIITCPEHGEFEQRPGNHLKGIGCAKCGFEISASYKKGSSTEFIKKAIEIHGNKYRYSETVYAAARSKVIITCPIHGNYEQTPCSHLQGSGCQKCAGVHRYGNEGFIEKAIKKHGNKYVYSKVDYENNRSRITITCKKHGDFEQSAGKHLSGDGCPRCIGRGKSTAEFISEALQVKEHQDKKYSYLKTNYVNSGTKIIVICEDHGEFSVTADNHLRGYGCPKCGAIKQGNSKRSNAESFIEKAKLVTDHQGKGYSYSDVVYLGTHNDVTITCPKHGSFEQQPANHLSGYGCPICANSIRVSAPEKEIFDFILQHAPDAVQSDRKVLGGKEIDIYIPSLNIGVEYNGLIMHSELYGKERSYHHKKSALSESKGIRLVHIWGDEWSDNRLWCENYLMRLLRVKQQVIYARKCTTRHISSSEVRGFLEQYHLQGCAGKDALAFYHDGEMVAVATTRKSGNGQIELARWCVKFGVTLHGGLGKVIKHLPFDISYCDSAKHDGHGYLAAGMKLLRKSQPSYWYTNGKVRRSRIDFQKHKLLQNPKAVGNTEKELANSLNWYAIGGLQQLVFGH